MGKLIFENGENENRGGEGDIEAIPLSTANQNVKQSITFSDSSGVLLVVAFVVRSDEFVGPSAVSMCLLLKNIYFVWHSPDITRKSTSVQWKPRAPTITAVPERCRIRTRMCCCVILVVLT